MAQTPEGKVKKQIEAFLQANGIFPAKKAGQFPDLCTGWYFMPVGSQFTPVKGIPDFIGFYAPDGVPVFWSIEAKAPGKKPTGFQKLQIDSIREAGGVCFVVDGDLSDFEEWLEEIKCSTMT